MLVFFEKLFYKSCCLSVIFLKNSLFMFIDIIIHILLWGVIHFKQN